MVISTFIWRNFFGIDYTTKGDEETKK